MNEGWIKLHRKTLENPIVCKDSDHLALWIYLLGNATHTEYNALFKGQRIILQPGQLLIGRKSIAAFLKVDENKVQRILKTFEGEQQIEQQTSNKNRLITVLNWGSYQKSEQQSEQQVISSFDTLESKKQKNTQKPNNRMNNSDVIENSVVSTVLRSSGNENEQQNEQQLNNKRTTSEQQVNTNKNVKNIENVKNDKNYKYIVEYLNQKTGKNFSTKTKPTTAKIHARLEEGFTVDDFKKVIDIKTSEWLNDADMQKYLRPETLFGNKFESYLNQKLKTQKQSSNPFLEMLKDEVEKGAHDE